MAAFQSVRIPHFCGTQKQVFQKAGCNARGPGGNRRSLDQLDVRKPRSSHHTRLTMLCTVQSFLTIKSEKDNSFKNIEGLQITFSPRSF